MRKLLIGGIALVFCASVIAADMDDADADATAGPAPAGEPIVVAANALADSVEPCPKVVRARRLQDGSIKAYCNNAEDYRVLMFKGEPIALRCSVLRKAHVQGC